MEWNFCPFKDMKIPVGIVGYGNLGKQVEKFLKNSKKYELKAVFSHRNLPNCENFSNILKYKDKIELLFLCGGSKSQLENQAFELVKYFNIAETYDNHNRLKIYQNELNKLAKQNKKIALCSLGWDPGLFSLMRGLFDSVGYSPYTFWGKGISQGHTQAIKEIDGVIDAIQFTVPNQDVIKKIKHGETIEYSKKCHKRLCYVVAEKDQERIYNQIVNMPDYFEDYETKVEFVCLEKLNKIKTLSHKGQVLTQNSVMNFSVNLKSNAEFTAKVLLCFAKNYQILKQQEKYGAFNIFDLPMKNVLEKSEFEYL